MSVRRFEPGETVVLREVWGDRTWSGIPAVMVDDADDVRRLFIGAGTIFEAARDPDGRWLRLPVGPWALAARTREPRSILSFALADFACGFLLMWDGDWRPLHWYLNLESPLRRTPIGFDYTDHVLDVIVSIDGSEVEWKDEDELRTAVELGLFSADEAAAFRAEGERATARLVAHRPPFDREWTEWRPHPDWRVPELPAGWDLV